MKKKMRIMVLALAVSFALMGAGYAAWGVKLTSNTTVNTGKWQVFLENDSNESLAAGDMVYHFDSTANHNKVADPVTTGIDGNDSQEIEKYDAVDGSAIAGAKKVDGKNWVYTIAPTLSGDTANFNFYNLHPGTIVKTDLELRNKGSIPAKIQNVTVKLAGGVTPTAAQAAIINDMLVKPNFSMHNGTGSYSPITNASKLPANPIPLKDLEKTLQEALIGQIIMPMEELKWTARASQEIESSFTFELPGKALETTTDRTAYEGGATAKTYLGSNTTLPITIDFDVVQYNEMPHVATPATYGN